MVGGGPLGEFRNSWPRTTPFDPVAGRRNETNKRGAGADFQPREWLAPLPRGLRRLRIVGGIGIVLGYSRDEPASGKRLQVRFQRVSNLLGIHIQVVHV